MLLDSLSSLLSFISIYKDSDVLFPYSSVNTFAVYVLVSSPLPPIFIDMLPLHSLNFLMFPSASSCLVASSRFDNVIVCVISAWFDADGLAGDIATCIDGVSPSSITPFPFLSPSCTPLMYTVMSSGLSVDVTLLL